MSNKGRDSAQRMLAIIVIIAMLAVMGIPVSVIVFFAVVTYFIWRAVQRTEHQETGRIFEFFISANNILRDEERRWFGFEIAEVIERGERVLHTMTDPPPLIYFALGALYHHAGDHEAAVEHLSYIMENDLSDERHRNSPSSELRRYVHILRKLEREPAEAPQTMAAIRSLERTRRTMGATLLNESRERLSMIPSLASSSRVSNDYPSPGSEHEAKPLMAKPQSVLAQPPPISDVLRDVYKEEKKTA
jgi:hypothetical protein